MQFTITKIITQELCELNVSTSSEQPTASPDMVVTIADREPSREQITF